MLSRLAVPLYLAVLFTGVASLVPARSRLCRLVATQPPQAKQQVKTDEPSWVVAGWGRDEQEAEQDALKRARGKVVAYLRRQSPPIAWTPPLDFVRDVLKRDGPRRDEKQDQAINEQVKALCWTIRVSILPTDHAEILRQDGRYRAQQRRLERTAVARERMALVGKILAAVVAGLLTLLAYIRLDDLTKGYYSRWLATGAVLLAIVGAGVWFLH
jgi:hypothetical protein